MKKFLHKKFLHKKFLYKLLSPWFFAAYSLAGSLYFALLLACKVKFRTASFIVWGLLTGSDPFNFDKLLAMNSLLWIGAWILHSASWLIVPALIGYLLIEKIAEIRRDIKQDQQSVLHKAMSLWVQAANVPESKRQETAEALLAAINEKEA